MLFINKEIYPIYNLSNIYTSVVPYIFIKVPYLLKSFKIKLFPAK